MPRCVASCIIFVNPRRRYDICGTKQGAYVLVLLGAMPVVALHCKRSYGTGLSVAIAALYPLSSLPTVPLGRQAPSSGALRPIGLRTDFRFRPYFREGVVWGRIIGLASYPFIHRPFRTLPCAQVRMCAKRNFAHTPTQAKPTPNGGTI